MKEEVGKVVYKESYNSEFPLTELVYRKARSSSIYSLIFLSIMIDFLSFDLILRISFIIAHNR